MGSSSKRSKDKDCKKRRHHNRQEPQSEEVVREKRRKHHHHHHHKHHRDRKREKRPRPEYESEDSDVEIVETVRAATPPPPQVQKEPSQASGGYHESLSIEETNKIRANLGLKPLQSSSAKNDDAIKNDGKKKDDLGEFYHKPADSLTAKIKQDKIRARLTDHKEKRNIDSRLSKVKLLSDVHNVDEDDPAAWVKKSRKLEAAKVEAEKRAKLLEELDEQFGIGEVIESEQRIKRIQQYNEQNLHGLQVNHDVDTFKEGHTVILTLKDQAVLDEDDDELVNVNMLDNERYLRSNENKKKKPQYSSYDNDDEIDEFGNLKRKSLLSKYDVEIDGEKREGFKIGYDNVAERRKLKLLNIKEKLANKLVDTLIMPELTIASDYYNEEEMAKFKKPKKKRKMRIKGKLTADDLERGGQQQTFEYDDTIALPANTKLELKEDENDDKLERALHKARKMKQKEALSLQEIKREPAEEAVDTGNITLNATAEFCRTLGDIPTYGKSGNREESENLLDLEKEEIEDLMDLEEPEEIDEGGRWNAVDPNRVIRQPLPEEPVIETPILEEEPDLSSGVGAALKLAMSKGYLDKEENNRPSNTRLAYLQAKHYSIEDKNYNDDTDRNQGGANRRERFAGPITDFREKDLYKPNVKLEYIDDEGHVLNAKEAFRYLSHKFHGKGPGKNKVEKRLKKVVQEGLMKKMSSTDTPLGTLNMLQSKQKEMQSPYIVLSGGKHTHSTTISKARQ